MNHIDPKLHESLLSSVYTVCTRATLPFTATLLIGGSKGKFNANPSTRMFSLSSLMSLPDEEFDMLGEDELALLTRRFEKMQRTG
jgi:hypothetical protein